MGLPEMQPPFNKDVFTDTTSKDSGLEDLSFDTEAIDRAAEKRLVRKCDLHVVPIVSLLYMFSFMDRINIGNARIQGLEKDLKMKGNNYNIALLIFFVPYILFEVPSNIVIRKVSPSTWLSSIMVAWGRFSDTTNEAFTKRRRNYHRLYGRHSELRRSYYLQISTRRF